MGRPEAAALRLPEAASEVGGRTLTRGGRLALCLAGLAAGLAGIGLSLAGLVGEDAFWEAAQFCLVALVTPATIVLGSPWALTRERRPRPDGGALERAAYGRSRHTSQLRAVVFVLPFCVAVVAWRLPLAVDAVARHPVLVLGELVTFVVTGIPLWLELVSAAPFKPRSPFPRRIVLAALPMWTTWIMSFVLGFARTVWFPAYHHTAGHGLSFIADQQVTAIVLWFIPFCVFVPVAFVNIVRSLRAGDDPDAELRTLVRQAARGQGLGPGDGLGSRGATSSR